VQFLRRVLKIQAALWGLTALALGALPATVLDALGQAPLDETAWLRILGVTALVLAMLMWLVAASLDTVWWWAWAFAVLEVLVTTVCLLTALVGLAPGASVWPWWVLGGLAAGFAVADMIGLARTSQEKPQV
jgi:hypothetical protein